MILDPLRLVANDPTETLNPLCRINLAKQYRIGFSVELREIGRLDLISRHKLIVYTDEIQRRESSSR